MKTIMAKVFQSGNSQAIRLPKAWRFSAQALRLGAVVVTHNRAEFQRVPDLSVEDWQDEASGER